MCFKYPGSRCKITLYQVEENKNHGFASSVSSFSVLAWAFLHEDLAVPRAARGQPQRANTFQVSACIIFAAVLLTNESPMAMFRVSLRAH